MSTIISLNRHGCWRQHGRGGSSLPRRKSPGHCVILGLGVLGLRRSLSAALHWRRMDTSELQVRGKGGGIGRRKDMTAETEEQILTRTLSPRQMVRLNYSTQKERRRASRAGESRFDARKWKDRKMTGKISGMIKAVVVARRRVGDIMAQIKTLSQISLSRLCVMTMPRTDAIATQVRDRTSGLSPRKTAGGPAFCWVPSRNTCFE